MKTSSSKAKGRNLQKLVRQKLLEKFHNLQPDDITSRSMGAGGEDLLLSPKARKYIPCSIECKNQEALNVWAGYKQAEDNADMHIPMLVIKRNHTDPLVVIDLDDFLDILGRVEHEEFIH